MNDGPRLQPGRGPDNECQSQCDEGRPRLTIALDHWNHTLVHHWPKTSSARLWFPVAVRLGERADRFLKPSFASNTALQLFVLTGPATIACEGRKQAPPVSRAVWSVLECGVDIDGGTRSERSDGSPFERASATHINLIR